jgi:cadmium resistance protein CadD (predicted permease)
MELLHDIKDISVVLSFSILIGYILVKKILFKFQKRYWRMLSYSGLYLGGALLILVGLIGVIITFFFLNFQYGLHFFLVVCIGIDSTFYGECKLYKNLGNDEEYKESYEAFKGVTKWLLILIAIEVLL